MKAIPFMRLVGQYAAVHQLPFFTWSQQAAAVASYKQKYLELIGGTEPC